MARQTRSGPLVAGMILILVGLGFLVENLFGSLSFWHLLSRYWPVFLIIIGVSKLYAFFTWEETPPLPGAQDSQTKE